MSPDAAPGPFRLIEAQRVFPEERPPHATISRLSILDATVARFAPAAAIWFYDKPDAEESQSLELFSSFKHALGKTLNDYQHFAGQIQWATEDMVRGTAVPRHLGRPVVVHGTPTDPGVELITMDCDADAADFVPDRASKEASPKVWNATSFQQQDFLPSTKIALSSLDALEGLPGVAVQLTAFRCGGFSVGIMFAHPLADALGLVSFMHSWAAHTRIRMGLDPGGKVQEPVFDPGQLDEIAGLDPSGNPDPLKIEKARALPMHRFDWWADDAPGYPAATRPATEATMPAKGDLEKAELSTSTFPPWTTWDMAAPVEHVQIRFSADELARMKDAAQKSLPASLESYSISRLDAALAHIWILMNRARGLQNSEEKVYLDISLGVRARVDPPLPDSFVGSPLLLAYVEKSGAEAASAKLGAVAGAIREMMSRFTPDAVAAYIHDAAHEVSPQRLWQGFLGANHALVTSWVRSGTYEVEFYRSGQRTRYVQGVMPRMDGLVHIMDIADTGDFDISVCLRREAVERMLDDPLLHSYDLSPRK